MSKRNGYKAKNANVMKATHDRYGMLRAGVYGGVASWDWVTPEILIKFVTEITSGGDAVVLGRSFDGKAITCTILTDGDPIRERATDGDQMEEFMETVLAALREDRAKPSEASLDAGGETDSALAVPVAVLAEETPQSVPQRPSKGAQGARVDRP